MNQKSKYFVGAIVVVLVVALIGIKAWQIKNLSASYLIDLSGIAENPTRFFRANKRTDFKLGFDEFGVELYQTEDGIEVKDSPIHMSFESPQYLLGKQMSFATDLGKSYPWYIQFAGAFNYLIYHPLLASYSQQVFDKQVVYTSPEVSPLSESQNLASQLLERCEIGQTISIMTNETVNQAYLLPEIRSESEESIFSELSVPLSESFYFTHQELLNMQFDLLYKPTFDSENTTLEQDRLVRIVKPLFSIKIFDSFGNIIHRQSYRPTYEDYTSRDGKVYVDFRVSVKLKDKPALYRMEINTQSQYDWEIVEIETDTAHLQTDNAETNNKYFSGTLVNSGCLTLNSDELGDIVVTNSLVNLDSGVTTFYFPNTIVSKINRAKIITFNLNSPVLSLSHQNLLNSLNGQTKLDSEGLISEPVSFFNIEIE